MGNDRRRNGVHTGAKHGEAESATEEKNKKGDDQKTCGDAMKTECVGGVEGGEPSAP